MMSVVRTAEPGPDHPTGGRLPLVPLDTEEPTLREIFDLYLGRGRQISDLYRSLGNAPAMLRGWTRLAFPLRFEADVDRGLRELVVMRVALLTEAAFEWQSHWAMGLDAGVTEAQLLALDDWGSSDAFDPDQRLVLAMADELTLDRDLSDPTFAALADRFPPGQVVELVLTGAYYHCVAQVLRALRFPTVAGDDRVAVYAQLRERMLGQA